MQALLARTKDNFTYDIDVSLTQYNIWYYRLGQYSEEQQKELLAHNEGFQVRHYDDISTLILKTVMAVKQTRPKLLGNPANYRKMPAEEWGLDEDVVILAPAFEMERSRLEYVVPSGSRGRSMPEWLVS